MNFSQFKKTFQKKPVSEFNNYAEVNPVLSVCVQTYNQVEFIRESLESILQQKTSFKFEVLIGDDNSTDGTTEICKEFATSYPDKVRLFLHNRKNNIKVDDNYTGLFNSLYNFFSARGRYIAYCDGDDFWTDQYKLQKQVDFLESNPSVSLCYHRAILVDKSGAKMENEDFLKSSEKDFTQQDLQKALVQPVISTWCFKNVVFDIPSEITETINADNFWISILGLHGEGKFLNDIKPSAYRIHDAGIWSLVQQTSQWKSKKRTYKNLAKFHAQANRKDLAKFFKQRSLNYSKMLILRYLKKGKVGSALRYLLDYFKNSVSAVA